MLHSYQLSPEVMLLTLIKTLSQFSVKSTIQCYFFLINEKETTIVFNFYIKHFLNSLLIKLITAIKVTFVL